LYLFETDNHNNTLKKSFTLDKYGYAIQNIGGNVNQIFGDMLTNQKKAFVANKHRISLRTKSN
jgi:hypothetical protein